MGKRIDIVVPEAARTLSQLERTAVRDRDLDREVAADWVAVDQQLGRFSAGY